MYLTRAIEITLQKIFCTSAKSVGNYYLNVATLYMQHPPFCSHLLTVERILELNDPPIPLPQDTRVFHVVAHQFSKGRKLLTSIHVIAVASILDLDVSYLIRMPEGRVDGR